MFSSIGSASMSARSSTVAPSPLRKSPTTPVPPTPSVTSYPCWRSQSAAMPAVRCSCIDEFGIGVDVLVYALELGQQFLRGIRQGLP